MTDAAGPYTTLTVAEYNHLSVTLTQLRWTIQKAREFLEQDKRTEALAILSKTEEE